MLIVVYISCTLPDMQAAVSGQPATDPVSNAVLPSLDLVPVWPMRSRAAEYRDSTIRACVQSASAPDCADPVKYLRRWVLLPFVQHAPCFLGLLLNKPNLQSMELRAAASLHNAGCQPI